MQQIDGYLFFEWRLPTWFNGHLNLAQTGYHLAECQVGWAYWTGHGVEIDFEQAAYWTKRAMEHGDPDAANNYPLIMEELSGKKLKISYTTEINKISVEMLSGFFAGWKKPLTPTRHFDLICNSTYFVAAIDDDSKKIIGFITALSDKVNAGFIPLLEVLPQYRVRGIGSRLMEMMLELLKDIACVDLTCDEEMQHFYGRFKMHKSNGMILRKY